MRGHPGHAASASAAADARRRQPFALLGLLLSSPYAACQSSLPNGVFTCTSDSECPAQMHCAPATQLCQRVVSTGKQTPGVAAAGGGAGKPGTTAGAMAGGKPGSVPIAVGSSGTSGGATAAGRSEAGGGGSSAVPGTGLCANGELACGDLCVPSDPQNCGSCDHSCTTLLHVTGPVTCAGSGKCSFPSSSCAAGWANCSNDPETGCETDITVPSHCGVCDVQCPSASPVCAASGCTSGCPTQTPNLCSGACVNNRTSANHCGACGSKCVTTVSHAEPICAQGSCGFECNSGFTKCAGACADFATDAANCGTCGTACAAGMACVAGKCACPAGTHDCSGACSKDTDVASCGTSCTPCRTNVAFAQPTCDQGMCSFECSALRTLCDGSCLDTLGDRANCGSCGHTCENSHSCALGVCICPSETHECGDTCASNTAPTSCGTRCNMPCPGPTSGTGTATCENAACSIRCTTGKLCGSACVDTNTDDANCGDCGMACTGTKHCVSGSCGCAVGTHDCGSSGCLVNTDVNSCGTTSSNCSPCPASTGGGGTPVCDTTGTPTCALQCPDGTIPCGGGCAATCP